MFSALVTHSGACHADDLFTAALLWTLAPEAALVRTRDDAVIAQHANDGGIVFDVGMIYDHAQRRYDHHQPGRALRADPVEGMDIPYSAFGLIWRHYGHAYIRAILPGFAGDIDTLAQQVDRRFVQRIDMGDNGTIPPSEGGLNHPLSITRLLETFAPDFDAPSGEEDAQFRQAASVAGAILANKVRTIAADQRAFTLAREAVRARTHPQWAELPTGMPYLGAVKIEKATALLYVLMPGRDGTEWQISAVRDPQGPLGCRQPFPAPWAGLRGADLVAATGVEDAVFCHMGRFLAVARSRAGALALLTLALAEAAPDAPTHTLA